VVGSPDQSTPLALIDYSLANEQGVILPSTAADGRFTVLGLVVEELILKVIPSLPPLEPVAGPGACFIATAAFGTPLAVEVEVLRRFRDEHLLTHSLGRVIIKSYEEISPPLAELIRRNPVLKSGARVALRPLIWMSRKVAE